MINANELRIGNWVRFKHLFCLIITIKQDNCEIQSDRIIVNSNYDDINPIPLTTEILENCGFEELEGNIYYKFFDYKEFRVFIRKENNSVFMYWKGNTVDDSVNNLPIHRLQNIIFALTGEELIYKP